MPEEVYKVIATREHRIYTERKEPLTTNILGMKGGRPYVDARLSRFSGEATSDWNGCKRRDGSLITGRRELSHCIPYLGRIVEKINQHVLGVRPVRNGIADEVLADITLDGESLNQFTRRLNSLVTACGWAWIGIDMQTLPVTNVSQADKERLKLRPYWKIYSALDVVDWHIDSKGGIAWVITEESKYEAPTPYIKAQCRKVRRLWEPGKVTTFVFKPGSMSEIESHEEVPLEISRGTALPVVPFVVVGTISGEPYQFDNLESVNRTIMDLESANRSNFFNCVFPQPYVPASLLDTVKQQFEVNAEEAVSMVFGQGYPILLDKDDPTPGYMMPDASATGLMRTEIDALKSAMFEVVGLMLQKETRQVASAEAKAWDYLDITQVMRERAEMLEDAEKKAVEITKMWDPTIAEWTPVYNRAFDVGNFSEEMKNIVEALSASMPDELNSFLLGKLYDRAKQIGTADIDDKAEKSITEAIQNWAPNAMFEVMPGGEGEDEGGDAKGDQCTVGARIDAVNRLVSAVAAGTVPRSSAIAQIKMFLQVSTEEAEALLGPVKVRPPEPTI